MDPGYARMRLVTSQGDFDFLLPGELPSLYSYSSEVQYADIFRRGNIEAGLEMWKKGQDQEVQLTLKLVVGISERIDNADDLVMYATMLMAIMQPAKKGVGPDTVEVYIGSWFHREAIVLGGGVSFTRPYDPETGKPYVAEVTLRLQYIYELPLPTADDFEFAP